MQKIFGLIGYPLTHSFSKQYFAEKFKKEQITGADYRLFPIEHISQFPNLLANNPNLTGLNVTIPYKESIMPLLDELDPISKAVGAVNCIKISGAVGNQLPILKGFNTDVVGFRKSIKPFLEIQHERALIIGTGGAAKAVAYVLAEIGIDCFFVTRNKNTAKIPADFKNKLFSFEEVNEYVIRAFKLIVNASPIGMYPAIDEAPPLPYQLLTTEHLLYDLVYNPSETAFLKQGKLNGAATVNGLSMLSLQAEEAWRIWNSN